MVYHKPNFYPSVLPIKKRPIPSLNLIKPNNIQNHNKHMQICKKIQTYRCNLAICVAAVSVLTTSPTPLPPRRCCADAIHTSAHPDDAVPAPATPLPASTLMCPLHECRCCCAIATRSPAFLPRHDHLQLTLPHAAIFA